MRLLCKFNKMNAMIKKSTPNFLLSSKQIHSVDAVCKKCVNPLNRVDMIINYSKALHVVNTKKIPVAWYVTLN